MLFRRLARLSQDEDSYTYKCETGTIVCPCDDMATKSGKERFVAAQDVGEVGTGGIEILHVDKTSRQISVVDRTSKVVEAGGQQELVERVHGILFVI